MITVHYNKRSFTLPQNFDEVTRRQFIALAPMMHDAGDHLQYLTRTILILSGMSVFRFRLLPTEVIEACLPLVTWVFEDSLGTAQRLPSYRRLTIRKYHGPTGDLDNLRLVEFHFAEMYYKQCLDENSDDGLNRLIAVLYRPAKWFYNFKKNAAGDPRVRFNPHLVDYRSRKIAAWPTSIKKAIFLWYDVCRQNLIDHNPNIFKKDGELQSKYEAGLYGMMRSLAGGKHGKVEEVETMYLHTAMLELNKMDEEYELLKSKMNA